MGGVDPDVLRDLVQDLGREPPVLGLRLVERREQERDLVGIARLQFFHRLVELFGEVLRHESCRAAQRSSSPAITLMLPRAATRSATRSPRTMGSIPW